MIHDLSSVIDRMIDVFVALTRARPREVAIGAALGAAGLIVLGAVAVLAGRYADSTARPAFHTLVPGEAWADPLPGAARMIRDSAGAIVLMAMTSFVLLGFGVLIALGLNLHPDFPPAVRRNTIAYFIVAAFFAFGFLLALVSLIRRWSLWWWFATCDRVRARARVLFSGERTWEDNEGNVTRDYLTYAYRVPSPDGRDRTFVAEEEIGGRERRRLGDAGELDVEYARSRPERVRRL